MGGEGVTWVLIGLAGAAGAAARLWVGGRVTGRRNGAGFPWGTFTVNILGSFLLGLLTGLLLGRAAFSPAVKTVLGTGFLGAFTTFSTWQVDLYRAYRRGDSRTAWSNLLLSTGVGLLAAWLGIVIGWGS